MNEKLIEVMEYQNKINEAQAILNDEMIEHMRGILMVVKDMAEEIERLQLLLIEKNGMSN